MFHDSARDVKIRMRITSMWTRRALVEQQKTRALPQFDIVYAMLTPSERRRIFTAAAAAATYSCVFGVSSSLFFSENESEREKKM